MLQVRRAPPHILSFYLLPCSDNSLLPSLNHMAACQEPDLAMPVLLLGARQSVLTSQGKCHPATLTWP